MKTFGYRSLKGRLGNAEILLQQYESVDWLTFNYGAAH